MIRRLLAKRFDASILDRIEVSTVDGFQGQEKEIIIFSCVRTGGRKGGIGFLDDPRRLNVAITRAKCSLFMIGDAEGLQGSRLWRELINDAKRRNLFYRY